MPLATISGVTLLSVTIEGSAPCSSNSLSSTMSPDCAARKKGVAPSSSSHWCVNTVRVSVLERVRREQPLDVIEVVHVRLARGIVAAFDVPVVGRDIERRPAAFVGDVGIGAMVEQIDAD